MAYKSNCKACDHPHEEMRCSHNVHKVGTIRLRSYNSTLWGVTGGYTKSYDMYGASGQEQVSFKPFDIGREEHFEYNQETECGCRFYIPSDNLEFLEWKYDEKSGK